MSLAVVFDSAGTLLRTYRTAKNVTTGEVIPHVETTNLTFSSDERVLIALNIHSREVIEASQSMLLSAYLAEHHIGFGISCTRKVLTADEVGEVLYSDTHARINDLSECIRDVWSCCKRESILSMNSGVIVNMGLPGIEFTLTVGGRPFSRAKETITALHKMGVPTFIASGDRVTKLERMADYLGIPRDRVFGIATPSIKARIVEDLKKEYETVVMVGDGINDIAAMKKADYAVLTRQQPGERPDRLYAAADQVIAEVCEVVQIVRKLQCPTQTI
jgi:soluble P-type ATPase